jgi:hypothetical protein
MVPTAEGVPVASNVIQWSGTARFSGTLSLEIAGAVLVAWTVFARSPVENREEALTKFGSNFWIVLFREREQAYAQRWAMPSWPLRPKSRPSRPTAIGPHRQLICHSRTLE